jgi:putative acetyltransferase
MLTIAAALSDRDLATVRELFQEYADSLDFDLGFQDFQQELENLPGDYAAPWGCIFLGFENGAAAGCVALRDFADDVAELKRLYVRPQFRSSGLGRLLTQRIIEEARARDYVRILLDTVPSMTAAIALYASLGFKPIAPYRYNPIDGALFMALELAR